MTKIDHRLALVERQRRFEWDLARDAQTRAASQFVRGKTHDLLNLVQIVQLASLELARRCTPEGQEFIDDLVRAADDAKHQLSELMEVARPEDAIAPGARVGAALSAAVATVREVSIPVDLHLALGAEVTTRCAAAELEHMIYGLALDAVAGEADGGNRPVELVVRERTIDGAPWLEIVCGARTTEADAAEHFDLRAVEAIAIKNGGELAHSERRGGGTEIVVALPIVS
jgi:signal transduction histidine kinase